MVKRVMAVVGLIVLLGVASQTLTFNPNELRDFIASRGELAPIFFVTIYALATVLFLPGSALTLVGGVLFGPFWGTILNLLGATTGALMSFVLSRHLLGDWVRQRSEKHFEKWSQRVDINGWRFVAFVRLVPLFPFNAVNYLLGLTQVPTRSYALATFVFMIPGCLAYTYLGYASGQALGGEEGWVRDAMIGASLVLAVSLLPKMVSKKRSM